jgi:hypothetical protein
VQYGEYVLDELFDVVYGRMILLFSPFFIFLPEQLVEGLRVLKHDFVTVPAH